ncbi:MAG: hypothetical protein U0528_18010 [Anaerolineae bacterium]
MRLKSALISIGKLLGSILFYGAIGLFIFNLLAMVSTVVIDSFARSWFRDGTTALIHY